MRTDYYWSKKLGEMLLPPKNWKPTKKNTKKTTKKEG